MVILPEDTSKSITSADVERCDQSRAAVGIGKRSKRSCLPESPVWPVFVIEGLELA